MTLKERRLERELSLPGAQDRVDLPAPRTIISQPSGCDDIAKKCLLFEICGNISNIAV